MFKLLKLQNFRSYKTQDFEFSPNVNIVVGANGSGKTNLLEAIYVLSRGNSFRGDNSELIRFGADWARIDAATTKNNYTLKLQVGSPSPTKQLLIDDKLSRQSKIPVVLFEPDQLRMIHGPPELRRAWLDGLLSQLEPAYNLALKNYLRALRQRNVLLPHGSNDDLFVWEMKMSEYGAIVASSRQQLIERFGSQINQLYQAVSGSEDDLKLNYRTPFANQYGTEFLRGLSERRERDKQKAFTTIGPHREDLEIMFNNQPVASLASRGEKRTLYLALKFIEAALVESVHGVKPVLLLDDLFGELDDRRKRHLQSVLVDHQIIITSTDDHPISGMLPATKRVIRL